MAPNAHPKNIAGYARLSITTEESVSLAGQVRMIHAEAERRGWPIPTMFVDENVSGSKAVARPARDDLERRISSGEFDAVFVKSVDRLARSVLDFHRIAAAAAKRGCALIVIEAGLDTSTPHGKMMLGILAQFAEFEAATIGVRVASSNVGIRKDGRTRGGPVPYGLRNTSRDDRPGMFRVVDDAQALIVLRMVDELLAGRSLRAIAEGLTRDGIPTPRATSDATAWGYTAIRRILDNPSIAGMERALGDIIRGEDGLRRVIEDARIIDVDTFRRVQEVLFERGEGVTRRTPYAERPLLDGLIFCSACQGDMRRVATTRKGKEPFLSYGCANADRLSNVCRERTTISAIPIDTHVVATFLDALGDIPRTRLEQAEDGRVSVALLEVRAEITDTAAAFASAPATEIPGLADRMARLRQTEALVLEAAEAAPIFAVVNTGQTWGQEWATLHGPDSTNADRRALLAEAISRVVVRKPSVKGAHEPAADRVSIEFGHDDT